MKINNNKQLMLLLFTSLIFSTHCFAQNSNEDFVENSITDNSVVVLDEIEIILKQKQKSSTKFHKTNETIIRNANLELENNFYKLFHQFNQSNEVVYPFAVSITERFIGTSLCPEICIHVKDHLVYKFKLLPNDSYLYAAVQESNKRLKEYYLDNKQLYAGK